LDNWVENRRFLALLNKVMPEQFVNLNHSLAVNVRHHPAQSRFPVSVVSSPIAV